jgi:hypothetical protein
MSKESFSCTGMTLRNMFSEPRRSRTQLLSMRNLQQKNGKDVMRRKKKNLHVSRAR